MRRSMVLLFGVVFACFALSPRTFDGDATATIPSAMAVLHHGTLDLSTVGLKYLPDGRGYTVFVVDPRRPHQRLPWVADPPPGDHLYEYFPWVTSLFAVPAVAGADFADAVGIHWLAPRRMLLRTGRHQAVALQLITASFWSALTAVVLAVIAWELLDALPPTRRRRVAFWVGLLAALGTVAWSTLSRGLWSQTPEVLCLALACLCLVRLDRGRGRTGWLALGLGAAAGTAFALRPAAIVMVGLVGLWLAVRKLRALPWYGAGVGLVLLPFVAVNLATYSRVLPPYFSANRARVQPDTLQALAANLFSPSRGLFPGVPLAVLAPVGAWFVLTRRSAVLSRSLSLLLVAVALGHWVVVSASGVPWWAGSAYGPRYMADLLPALVVLAIPAVEWLTVRPPRSWPVVAVGALAVVSVLVNAQPGLLAPATCWGNDRAGGLAGHTDRIWDPVHAQSLAAVDELAHTGSISAAVTACPSYR